VELIREGILYEIFRRRNRNKETPFNETVVIVQHKEAMEIIDALTAYVKTNPRKQNVKKLLKEMEDKWGCYSY